MRSSKTLGVRKLRVRLFRVIRRHAEAGRLQIAPSMARVRRRRCNQFGGWPFSAMYGSALLSIPVVDDPSLGADPMDFPILDLMDQEGCCQKLFDLLHPDGFACPRCAARDGLDVHRRRPDSPVVDYRCTGCRRVFNMFTGTLWQGTHLSPGQILLILRGIAQGVPAAKLAREVGIRWPKP